MLCYPSSSGDFMKRLLSITIAGLLCVAAMAQDKAKTDPKKKAAATPAGTPAAPKPAAEMKELRQMVGTWTTEETMEVSPFMPQGGTGAGNNTTRLGPGGFSVIVDHRSKGSMGSFSGHGITSWDPNEKAYKSIWVDSMSQGVVTQTGKKEGTTLVFTGQTMMEGKKIATRDVFSDFTPTSFTITSFMNDGSGDKKFMTMKFTRLESAAKK